MDALKPSSSADSGISIQVLGGGLITGAVALLGVWALGRWSDDANVMGWYANYVLPVGAILVGLVAGIGFGFAAWWMDRRVGNLMLLLIVLMQVGVYLGAQYLEYRQFDPRYDDDTPVEFWVYFDFITRAFAFKPKYGDGPGEMMGVWGYAFRALEMAGFAFGGLIAPLILRTLPYCHHCGVYMKTRPLGILPAGLRPRKFKKGENDARAAHDRDEEQVMNESLKTVEQLTQFAAQGRTNAIAQQMQPYATQRKENDRLSCRLHVTVNECRMCGNGTLTVTAHRGIGKEISQVRIVSVPLRVNSEQDEAQTPALG